PVNTSKRRAGSRSLDLSVSSEIVMCRSPQRLRTSFLTITRERCRRNSAYARSAGIRDQPILPNSLTGSTGLATVAAGVSLAMPQSANLSNATSTD
ncbi:MAG: hypothetical protein J0I98_18845, partial [Mesorhizobium sp.]